LNYIRLGIFPISEVLPYIIIDTNKLPKVADRGQLLFKSYIGYPVKMNSRNLQVFKTKGIICNGCGLKGRYFALEIQFSDWPKPYYTLNMYGKKNILFTKDHIIPKSVGGSDGLDNLNTMCINCNLKKSDNMTKKSEGKLKGNVLCAICNQPIRLKEFLDKHSFNYWKETGICQECQDENAHLFREWNPLLPLKTRTK